ncbi:MAG TPA: coproporphyrinogen-III oxidase family protein, partial [Alphaproteobacteria bacterium]|nr:coproporphyrinogen-III oxidase family protein [Alphaproteobacteria bacterium]
SRFAAFRAAGVNRLSLGVQALDDADLAALGRGHSAAEAQAAVALAARIFDRYSFDLIYARPRQSRAAWETELRRAVALAGDHMSVYQLTIEPGTAFAARHARGELVVPDEYDAAALYEATQAILDDAGLAAYEVSNHARAGAECRHNLAYWRYEDYIGVGPGAHGRLKLGGVKTATRQEKAPETWLEAVERHGHATAERRTLARGEAAEEALMMGLRLSEGVDPDRFARETSASLESAISATSLARLADGGFIVRRPGGALAATPAGRRVLNAVLAKLIA